MEAIVLAGGFGTRLKHVVSDVPKPMAPIQDKPFLEYLLTDLAKKGVTRVILAVGYMHEIIMKYFSNDFLGMQLVYSIETTPLLTGGAIRQALSYCHEPNVFVMNGDTFFDVPLQAMLQAHLSCDADISLAVKEMFDFSRYGTVDFDKNGRIEDFCEKQPIDQGYINGGVYIIPRTLLLTYPPVFSFEKQVLERDFNRYNMHAFPCEGFFIDIGVPEDYQRAQGMFEGHE